jgi:hypothetical protein
MKLQLRLAGALCLAAALSGCPLLKKTSDIGKVHEAYRKEFASAFLAGVDDPEGATPKKVNLCRVSPQDPAGTFPMTTQAIEDFRAKHQGDATAKAHLAHLTILMAMIQLQVGNTGIARSMEDEVRQATLPSAKEDAVVRDRLFQQAFPGLVDGWEAVCDLEKDSPGGVYSSGEPQKDKLRVDKLSGAASEVAAATQTQRTAAAGPATDEGAIYLGTTAGIFQYYAYRVDHDGCMLRLDETQCRAVGKDRATAAVKAIEPFLTPAEKDAASRKDLTGIKAGRLRYVQWYQFLGAVAAMTGG